MTRLYLSPPGEIRSLLRREKATGFVCYLATVSRVAAGELWLDGCADVRCTLRCVVAGSSRGSWDSEGRKWTGMKVEIKKVSLKLLLLFRFEIQFLHLISLRA